MLLLQFLLVTAALASLTDECQALSLIMNSLDGSRAYDFSDNCCSTTNIICDVLETKIIKL